MGDTLKYYVLRGDDCLFEGMTKEQILAAIAEATGNTVSDVDSAFITKVKEQNKGGELKFWVGTQAEYNAQKNNIAQGTFSIITDDTTAEDIEAELIEFQNAINAMYETVGQMRYDLLPVVLFSSSTPTISGMLTNYTDDFVRFRVQLFTGTNQQIGTSAFIEFDLIDILQAGTPGSDLKCYKTFYTMGQDENGRFDIWRTYTLNISKATGEFFASVDEEYSGRDYSNESIQFTKIIGYRN
jgi:hypothetical protein